uniref:Uncharacterized protein n=1 Tax=Rhizophora mucronata TaxID=61149 RepID=A0A2P2P7B5_RHIMU
MLTTLAAGVSSSVSPTKTLKALPNKPQRKTMSTFRQTLSALPLLSA